MLGALREPGAGRPSLLARLVAGVVVLGLLAVTAPVLVVVGAPVLRWLARVVL